MADNWAYQSQLVSLFILIYLLLFFFYLFICLFYLWIQFLCIYFLIIITIIDIFIYLLLLMFYSFMYLFYSRFYVIILFMYLFSRPRGVMVKAIDCGIVISEFEHQSRYYVHTQTNTVRKGMNSLILPASG